MPSTSISRRIHLFRSLLVAVPCLAASSASAQTATSPSTPPVPPLEVISVKPVAPGTEGGSIGLRADGLYARAVPFIFLIRIAFRQEFAGDRIVNMPSWSSTDLFDITGKVAEADLPAIQHPDPARTRELRAEFLQSVLSERFYLKSHTEEREGPVYALVPAKGGPRIKPTGPQPPLEFIAPNGAHIAFGSSSSPGDINGHGVPLSRLVASLLNDGQLNRIVIDRTGLTGDFDYSLRWTPEGATLPGDNGAPPDSNLPSLFTAIQEQLGLKLEATKGPIKVLVIDHVEKPSEN